MEVILSSWEILLAAQAGIMRQVENLKKNRQPYYGAGSENDWQLHIEGCLGELAVAKFLGLYWSGKGELRLPDVGIYDVRTGSKPHHRLILHPEDPDDRQFWLVTGANGHYTIRGWIFGRDGKQAQYWQDPTGQRPAYFIPHSALRAPEGK